ncbi:MAG: fibrillarin-like rRNA/tRNA 2'-O-methyltransferase [Candidatus Nanohaloarchaea archaeon]|nr:fibrillarin-like rRNA/tRNA 2'-O-methyltransferase [Candidatus Nanohaloarchaea archaeon]
MPIRETFNSVWKTDERLYTKNPVKGEDVYGERLKQYQGDEYRQWNPNRSKLGAAIEKGLPALPINRDSRVLYLGASTGTTPSHVADICQDGIVFGVEYAAKVIQDLLNLSEQRHNLAPILGDARTPDQYRDIVDQADVIVQDVAQPDQYKILERNADLFLQEDGDALVAIKARSISSSQPVEQTFQEQKELFRQTFTIEWSSRLEPYENDHLFLHLRR